MTEHSIDLQKLFLEMLLHDPEIFVRVRNIYNPENFHRSLKPQAKFIKKYAEDYGDLPDVNIINSSTNGTLEKLDNVKESEYDWFMNEFEHFNKKNEMERAILEGADLIKNGSDYGVIEKLIKDAVQTGLTKDLGINYWDNPKERLLRLKQNNGQISTGWESLDNKLFGGFNKGELNLFLGGSNAGKSLFLQNIAVNWIMNGYNVVYITLELSEELTAMRMDSMISGVSSKRIFKDLDNVALDVAMKGKNSGIGVMQIKYLPAQSNSNDIRSYLKEFSIQTNNKIDAVLIDYLDLCMPAGVKVDPSDVFTKDKYVSEELRNLAKEMDVSMLSASQLNRSSVNESEYSHAMISGGLSKINTADNVIGIYSTREMREQGKYQLQLMKTRNSNGKDAKIDLLFDTDTIRITDPGIDAQSTTSSIHSTNIMNKIKDRENSAQSTEHTQEKLNSLLDGLKKK